MARPRAELRLARVLQTHEAVGMLQAVQKWVLTYAYCYPHLERWQVLRSVKKYVGRRLTWKEYLHELEMGRYRVWARVLNEREAA